MSAHPLDDVEHIRRLLAPERSARRPVPAQGLPAVRVRVDERPAVVYAGFLVDELDAPRVVRRARRLHASERHDAPDPGAHALAARRERALVSLSVRGMGERPLRRSAVFRQSLEGSLTR